MFGPAAKIEDGDSIGGSRDSSRDAWPTVDHSRGARLRFQPIVAMKFALLGVDQDALDLTRQLCRSREHELCVAYDVGPSREAICELAPRVETGDAPEALLARPEIDAVVVATSEERQAREQQLRTLIQGGLRLVVMLPICDALTAYELEMIRADHGAVMVPYNAGRGHPAIDALAAVVRDGGHSPIGKVEQIVVERHLARRQRSTVIPLLCADGHAIGRLIGDIEGVSASGDRDDPYRNLSVVLNGANSLTARWNVVPSDREGRARMTLHGTAGTLQLEMSADRPWVIGGTHGDQFAPAAADWSAWTPATAVVAELDGQRAGLGTWFEACRDLEIADHVAASLRRRRTIEIRRDANPEENAFKGIMSAGGCLILLLCLLVTLAFAVVEGFRMPMMTDAAEVLEMRDQEKPRTHILLRLWPVYPLLAFLALQALLVVAKAGRKERSQASEQD